MQRDEHVLSLPMCTHVPNIAACISLLERWWTSILFYYNPGMCTSSLSNLEKVVFSPEHISYLSLTSLYFPMNLFLKERKGKTKGRKEGGREEGGTEGGKYRGREGQRNRGKGREEGRHKGRKE